MEYYDLKHYILFAALLIVCLVRGKWIKKRAQRRRPLPSSRGTCEYPVVLSMPAAIIGAGQRRAYYTFVYVTCLAGITVGYIIGHISYGETYALIFAVVGLVCGLWLAGQVKELKPVDESHLIRTAGREIIVEEHAMKLSRALFTLENSQPQDEVDYYVIPFDGRCRVRYVFTNPPKAAPYFLYVIEYSGRKLNLKADLLGKHEAKFVSALYGRGIQILEAE